MSVSGDTQQPESQVIKLKFTLHRASNLPQSRLGRSKYFAVLKTNFGWTDRTDQHRGKDPKWNKDFICDVKAPGPSVSIEIFRIGIGVSREPQLVAIASPDVTPCFQTSSASDILVVGCPLLSPTSSSLDNATIFYSCSLRDHEELTPDALHEMLGREVAIPEMKTPGGADLSMAVSVASSDTARSIINILGKIDQVGKVITDLHPYASVAWNALNAAQRVVTAQIDRDDRVRYLWNRVGDILDLVDPLGKYKDHGLYKKKVEAILKQIYECVLFLRWYAEKGFVARVVRDVLSGRAEDGIKGFEKTFQDLWKSLQDSFSVDIIEQTYRLVAATECIAEIAADEHLDRLPGATLSCVEYDKQRTCLPGTRTELVKDIEEWIHAPGVGCERVLWLSGPAGTGKSSVANSIAERMDSLGRLAASFRFDRSQADRTPAVLIGNLCRQVSRFNNSLKGALLEAVKRHGTGNSLPCASQAEKLFVRPISKIDLVGPIVIVIDALDESGNDEPVLGGTNRETLIQAIVDEFIHLPLSVKLLITSREEGCIMALMSASGLCKRLRITETSGVKDDIEMFVETQLGHIRKSKQREPNWPGREKVQALTQYANGLFICAAVACNFIKAGLDPDSQMKILFDSSNPHKLTALDGLYMTVIEQSAKGIQSDVDMSNWQRVVGTISAVRTPLTVIEMDALLGLPTNCLRTTRDFTDSLLPLLMVDTDKIQLLHKSVFDFLTTQTRIRIDLPVWHRALAVDCLAYMNKNLGYDMEWISLPAAGMNSSNGLRNTSALRYACREFAKHLSESSLDPGPCINQLGIFLVEHLLHWFEVMARLKQIYEVEESLKLLLVCLTISCANGDGDRENDEIVELSNIIRDGISFVRTFRSMCVLSPMDIYRSGIAMSPQESRMYKLYSSFMRLPKVISTSHLWSGSLCVFEGHNNGVTTVAFSVDGKLASGSWDTTVRLWDAEKGESIGSALEGHRDTVMSVVFSPDGKKIASGSSDKTVRLWNAEKGEAIGSALEGHRDKVTSIVFSPDGKKIASGSDDKTVRLWDAEKGEAFGSPLEGHRAEVTSIVFSPDGKKIASGSRDNTVRLWDAEKGEAVGSALEGHREKVTSIVFSPDGKKIASGSDDKTVRLWDAEKVEAIGSALEGHRAEVTSIVFSPDGKKIASGSRDNTVRLWDAEKGEAVGSALEGHRDWVTSIVFSPDGKKIASGSWDHTVRLWDAEKVEAIGSAFEGHRDWVTSVVFSPDGKKIASGSSDKTVRLWDAEKGEAVGSALEGHRDWVTSIVFSPDGKKIASGSHDKTVRLWDAEKGEAFGSPLEGHRAEVTSIVFSPDGKKIASGSRDNTVRLWDAEKGEAIGSALEGHRSAVQSVVFSPDGKKIASGSWDNTVRLWEAEKAEAIGSAFEGHRDWVTSVVFSPDGKKIASGSSDKTVRLWDAEKGEAVGSALEGHRDWVTSVVFSPDGKKIASGSSDKTVRLWDAEKGEAFGSPLEGHRAEVTSIVFSPDGKKIASGSRDNTVRLWDAETGEAIGSALEGHCDGVSIVFSPSAQSVTSGYRGRTVPLWDEHLVDVHHTSPHTSDIKLVQHDQSNNSGSIVTTANPSIPIEAPASLFQLTINRTGFLINDEGHQLIWIPAHLRGDEISVYSSTRTVVIGGASGAITIIRFASDR